MYDDVIKDLRRAYDAKATDREQHSESGWKAVERDYFLTMLRREQKQSLLEIGAGPGKYGQYFQAAGLAVVCTDLSPAMVELCRKKGLQAHVMDFLHLELPHESFDSVFALNCLLHVPKSDLQEVLSSIRQLLQPDGLFYMGLYGGIDSEELKADDDHEPKRFFSFHTDEQMQAAVTLQFDLEYFKSIPMGEPSLDFQSLILRKRNKD